MIPRLPSLLLLVAAAPTIASADRMPADPGTQWAQLTVRERIIIRIPRVPTPPPSPPRAAPPIEWEERRAPRCVPVAALTGAALGRDGMLDLMTADGRRLRARLEDDCPALDFYSGFYVKPRSDGNICARRDAIRSRSGARCQIAAFRTLVAPR